MSRLKKLQKSISQQVQSQEFLRKLSEILSSRNT